MAVIERAQRVWQAFAQRAGRPPDGVWAAPGRINLIGEHTDYNGGFVLPVAIGRYTMAAVALRADGRARCWSVQRPDEPVDVRLAEVSPGHGQLGWGLYPLGVAWALRERGVSLVGFDLVVDSDLPVGMGMSSSAALVGAVALALAELAAARLTRPELARVGQRAENAMVGAPTGIMDQMAVLCGQDGHALFLDCRTLRSRQVPFDVRRAGLRLLVVDTRVSHAHGSGGYAARRRSCEHVAAALGVCALRDLDLAVLEAAEHHLDRVEFRRARHVITENTRVLEAADLLDHGELARVGPLLDSSHASMRDDFEISTPELDVAVDVARAAGAVGARMTGGGFGGSAIALVPVEAVSTVENGVRKAFAARSFTGPDVFEVLAVDPARRVPGAAVGGPGGR